MIHFLKFNWDDPPRETTRENWYAAQRYFRTCRRDVEAKFNMDAFSSSVADALCTGSGSMCIEA